MQIKIGFDKFPVPSITTEVPLYDIVSGNKLTDAGGIPLVTEAEKSISEVATKEKATSVITDPETIQPWPVVEIFPEVSETSTTLLGIPRAETQLSLFSDVSVLGLDTDHWEVFNFTSPNHYGPWDTRATKTYGNHYYAKMTEESGEQAISIGCFPVPYEYPFGPRWEDQGLYNEILFSQYKSFVELGGILYTYYSSIENQALYGPEFKDKFLDPDKVSFINEDIVYTGVTEAEGLLLIDEWTRTWVDIRANKLLDPRTSSSIIREADINAITGGNPSIADTRPGYSSERVYFSYLQSRRAFRYQPGRISGFTFGAKLSTDSGDNSNILEWGITNPTDQYVFQIRGSSFSIVRRSTIPLSANVILGMGLNPETDQPYIASGDPFDINPNTQEPNKYYTAVIPREQFNGDPVNGNGPSRYLLNPSFVTMYKIEFGWYGAIGARFFAYVPIDNNEGRWILLHTIVIENRLGQPCLEDPFFRFRYSVNVSQQATITSPQFIYKYGASMYIDGGDQGTVTQRSYSSAQRSINSTTPKSLVGIYPKRVIVNNEGVSKPNKKAVIPKQVSVYSDALAKVQIIKCNACPGYGYNYNYGLIGSETGRTIHIKFNSARNKLIASDFVDPLNPIATELFQLTDYDSKIIADGLYSGYIGSIDTESAIRDGLGEIIGYEEASINRINTGYTKTINSGFPAQVIPQTTGTLLTIPNDGTDYPYAIRLSKFDGVAGSTIPLTGSQISIQYLNPVPFDDFGHFAEFLIGVTDKKPLDVIGELKWQYGSEERSTLALEDVLYGDFTQSTTGRDRNGYETTEANYPYEYKGELDYRIPNPSGDSTGKCSQYIVTVLNKSELNGTLVLNNPKTGVIDGNYYIRLTAGLSFLSGSILGGELGVNNLATGIFFASEQDSFVEDLNTIYFAKLTAIVPGYSVGNPITIQLTPVNISGKHVDKNKIFKFNPFPLYLVAMTRDNSRINSISITEVIGETTVSSSPKWILNTNITLDTVGGKAQSDLPPVNFVSTQRLDSAAVDLQLEQQLRPSKTLDTFFVGAGETTTIDLNKIYGADRENIVSDLFGTEATFFVGNTLSESTGLIQISLNTAEQ